ncbi:MAG: DUF374 domain-containing protein [Verrucomicrobia bacterium]|nr:DUF374 domain-containing protein [Verrucomicrobiota bacterium]
MTFLGWILRVVVTAIGATLRWRIEDPHGLLVHTPTEPLIFAFWHNRILMLPYLFKKHWSKRKRDRVAVLVSASKDGEKLSRVLEQFDLICVRGSSSRRGRQALVELTKLVQDGYDIGITPDGPRGPKYKVQDGAISLAQVTGAAIMPVSWSVDRKFVFRKAWDNFQVPAPFARAVVHVGKPIVVPRDADADTRENKRLELERVLQTLCDNSP